MTGKYSRDTIMKWAVTIGILVGTVIIVAFAFLYKLPTVFKYDSDIASSAGNKVNSAFLSVASSNEEATAPFLKTGFENIFVSVDKDGTVTFYKYENNHFKERKCDKTLKATVTLDGESRTISLYCVEEDDNIEGYGLYLNPQSMDCPYAFFKVENMKNDSSDEYDLLLLADYTKDDFYKNDKTYSAGFALDTTKMKSQRIFKNDYVRAGENGLTDNDYVAIPNEMTNIETDGFFFLSDRNYAQGKMYDLYLQPSVTSAEKKICENVLSPNFWYNKRNIYLFIEDDNGESFNLCSVYNEKTKKIKNFSGSIDQYVIRGDYIFNPSTKVLYNVISGEEINIAYSGTISAVDDFTVSSDETKFAMAGKFGGNSEKLFFYNLSSEKSQVIDGTNLFIEANPNLTFIGDSVLLLMPSDSEDKVINFVTSWDAIFSIE